jgi:methionyl-tRNA formyltransferase
VRVVLAGTPAVAVPSLEALVASRHEVITVLTRPAAPSGRGRRLTASPLAEAAEAAGIPVLSPRSVREPEFHDELRALAPDCCPVVAYGGLVPQSALAIPRHGWINLHFSLLPAWRGAAPVQHAVLHGDDVTGASVFQLEAGLDTGPVFGITTETVRPTDTTGDLLGRLALSGAALLVATLDGIEDGSLVAVPQPCDGVSVAPRLTPDDAHIDWTAPAVAIDRKVRACTPAPGAWTMFRDERLRLAEPVQVRLQTDGPPLRPGQVMSVKGGEVLVGTGTHSVALGEVLPEGKRTMPAKAWANGARLLDDDELR